MACKYIFTITVYDCQYIVNQTNSDIAVLILAVFGVRVFQAKIISENPGRNIK